VLRSESGNRFLSVAHVSEMARRQLREYVRLECLNEAAFHVIRSDAAPDLVKEARRYKGLLNDIGGGGVNLRTAEEFHVGDVLLLSFTFMGEDFFGIKGRIVRLLAKTMHGERAFQNHIGFIEMDNTLREKIVKYIFKKQREETP
jgi:c-di-GMP-binding flagellar brake protein YcgR